MRCTPLTSDACRLIAQGSRQRWEDYDRQTNSWRRPLDSEPDTRLQHPFPALQRVRSFYHLDLCFPATSFIIIINDGSIIAFLPLTPTGTYAGGSVAARVRLNIWDVGGQATLRPYWQNYYERTDALLWVVDSADIERLRICKAELHQLLQEEKLAGATLLILANKQDLPGALSAADIKKVLELKAAGTRHWRILGCSAVTGAGLLAGFDWVLSDIQGRIQLT
jgi:small GTP-binding protein